MKIFGVIQELEKNYLSFGFIWKVPFWNEQWIGRVSYGKLLMNVLF
jgi:hypothetical protein